MPADTQVITYLQKFQKSEVCTSTIKITFCVVHLTGMLEGLIRYIFY